MSKISLLDCTLRDGGYINNWEFGTETISETKRLLEEAGVDILELGFLRKEPYQNGRTVFNSVDQVKALIGNKRPGMQYAVMAEVANPFPLEMLEPADDQGPDIIRVIVWKTKRNSQGFEVDALQEGFLYCKGIVEKGYRLCVQPARVDQYSEEEFVAMVERFAELDPMAVYVVDSWGTQNPEDLLRYMRFADRHMPAHISLGYHGHNNMMQAMSTAQVMMKENFRRDLILDASVYGIGRGAGNLNLELIGKYMDEQLGTDYDIDPMLEIYERYVKDIYDMEPWGYSIPFLLTAKYNCNPNYARYLGNRLHLDADRICFVLKSLPVECRTIYSKEAADRCLASYHAEERK